MIGKAFFTKDRNDVPDIIDSITARKDFDEVHCLYTPGSKLFDPFLFLMKDINFISFDDYGKNCKEVLQDNENNLMIVLGISDMMRPANRCDQRFEYMFNYSKYGRKYSIDRVPFREEIWRIMWPYSVLHTTILEFNHSYAAESAYRAFQEGRTDENPLAVPWIVSKIGEHTEMRYKRFFDFEVRFEIHPTTDAQKAEYAALKEELFNTKNNIRSIISGLAKYARSIQPKRNIFTDMKKLYDIEESITFHVTDLKVDAYLQSEIERIIGETNQLTEGLYAANLHR
ncbi:MAG TPA: hypothetical protein VN455_01705 [Methanotrichaceae archaeon]|nr:hypothetical protein [Methanotrichaceae archaeon]